MTEEHLRWGEKKENALLWPNYGNEAVKND